MKRLNRVLWGIVLVALGVIFALNAFDIVKVDMFFDGWWTLFIIVPCGIGVISGNDKTGNLVGLFIGVLLLLNCQGILTAATIWKLVIPVIIIFIGLKLIFGGMFGNKAEKIFSDMKKEGAEPKVTCAVFSDQKLNFTGDVFNGAELTAVFGGVKCDLRGSIIEGDCAISVSAIFGGITIYVPPYVNVKVNSNSIFGGISNKVVNTPANNITLYVTGTCMFGGVDIK